jgi:hypothetical protein
LEEHPEWRTELRRLVLTDELLTLPETVRELAEAQRRTEQRLEELAEAQRHTEQRIEELAQAQRRTEDRLQQLAEEFAAFRIETERHFQALAEALEALIQRTEQLAETVGAIKGDVLEIRYREHAPAYFDDLLRRIRVVPSHELATLLDEPLDKGALSKAERKDLLMSDLVVRGRRWDDDAETYLVVEVSAGIGKGDVERVVRWAEILSRALGRPAIAVVTGEWLTPEAERLAKGWGVWRVLDGQVLAPGEE